MGIDIKGIENEVKEVIDGRKIGQVYVGERRLDVKRVQKKKKIKDKKDIENILMKKEDGRYVKM